MLVVTHKKYQFPNDGIYIPIQVNSCNNGKFGYQTDLEGDNISQKNNNYCELTALYWAWKNLKCDYIGINHYRRYMTLKSKKHIKKAKTIDEKFELILSKKEIEEEMNNYDIMVPMTKLYIKNVYSKYAQQHHIKDLDNCRNIITKLYPDYINSFDKIMKRKQYCICNMCVMPKKKFNDYCKWLFDILFELEKNTDISNYSPLQKRIYGFLSERLFNVWIEKNKLKVKKVNMVSLEHDSIKVLIKKARKRLLHIKS